MMQRHCFFEFTIPRRIVPPANLADSADYRTLLEAKVFPAIDELNHKGLIDSYHFLTHAGLDVRISVKREDTIEQVKTVLARHGLPTQLAKWPRKGDRSVVEDEVLRLNAEIVRQLLGHSEPASFYPSVVHYQNNAYGMGNLEEVDFHLRQAFAWYITLLARSQPALPPAERDKSVQTNLIEAIRSFGNRSGRQ